MLTSMFPDQGWLKAVLENIPNALVVIDQTGGIHYINTETLPAVSEALPAGKNIHDIASSELQDELRRGLNRTLSEQPDGFFELTRRLSERTRCVQELSRYLHEGEKFNIRLARAQSVHEVCQIFAEHIHAALDADFTAIYHLEEGIIQPVANVNAPVLLHRKEMAEPDSLLQRLFDTGQPLLYDPFDAAIGRSLWRNSIGQRELQSLLLFPLLCGPGFRAVLYLGYHKHRPFTVHDHQLLRTFVEAAQDSISRIRALQQVERQIRFREQELALLYDIGQIASHTCDLPSLLKKALERLLRTVNSENGMIHPAEAAVDMQTDHFIVVWPRAGIPDWVKTYLLNDARPPRAAEQGKKFYLDDLPPNATNACLAVPISVMGNAAFVLRLFGDAESMREPETIHLVSAVADQIGLAVENIQHRKLAEEAIVLEERQRLARNLHDSVTHSLYGLVLSSDISKKMLDRGDYQQLSDLQEEITASALQALKEMRLMLFELRPMALENEGIIQALELRFDTVERRAGIDAQLIAQGIPLLPSQLEIELYHIATEALNNSLRHSGAQSVRVSIKVTLRSISMEVSDNGQGFDLEKQTRGGIGLSSMRERAQKLGGTLTIVSEPLKGTSVRFRIRRKEIQ